MNRNRIRNHKSQLKGWAFLSMVLLLWFVLASAGSSAAGEAYGNPGRTDAEGSVIISPSEPELAIVCGIQAAAEPATYAMGGNGTGAIIEVTNDGTDLDCLEAVLVGGNHPNATPPLQVGEYWQLEGYQSDQTTPATDNYLVNLTLTAPFTPDSDDKLCRWSGTAWSCAMTSFTGTTITRNNVAAFSDWVTGDETGPLAVTMGGSGATIPARGGVLLVVVGLAIGLTGVWLRRRRVGS
jgi:hypothetical protein